MTEITKSMLQTLAAQLSALREERARIDKQIAHQKRWKLAQGLDGLRQERTQVVAKIGHLESQERTLRLA